MSVSQRAVDAPQIDAAQAVIPATEPTAPTAACAERRLRHPRSVTSRVIWVYAAPLAGIHLLALLALWPWLFSWSGLILLAGGIYFYGGIGIDLCYHRLLTHRSFAVPLWLERAFAVVALCCLEDSPGSWVATHRLHHNESDEQEDPHSPLVNFLWGHVNWLLFENRNVRNRSAYDRFARDVLRDPFYMRLQRNPAIVFWIYAAHAALYFLAGLAVGWLTVSLAAGVQLGYSWLVWGVLLRTVCVWHISWTVNSLSHLFGYRNYDTPDNSRNNWLVALLTSGEGWHNNHHFDPASASNAHRWWEFDLIYLFIRLLERLGLATRVVRPRHQRKTG
jgi:fatty-acid desaturase